MRRFCIGLTVVAILSLTIVGCGSSDNGAAEKPSATETSTTQSSSTPSSSADTPTTQTPTTQTPTTAPADDTWTTVATLRSSDPPWNDMPGILISEPFAVTGDLQVVLDMPDAGDMDGVIAAIVAADKASDVSALLGALGDAAIVTMMPAAPTQEVSGLDGTYVLVNSVPTAKEWSLDVQTKP
ncbi:MAG: hypothetical protein KKA32_10345 [Actinobacteria bacterium]|nr:hypothetical protein [Actinomycetota bacterium]